MKIKSLRESKNLTQQQLADLVSVQRSTVSMWETGESFPRAEVLRRLAKILGCSVDELLGSE
ncbi:MAG: helix-turn-helix transcriptional regulator [Eubacteriales bacterium]|nr:helix-turn-helix transcriptional regulator [Eubacteriales bacterium]